MKKKILLLLIVNYCLMADFIGGEINIGYLFHQSSGKIGYQSNTLSFQNDLRFSLDKKIYKRDNHLFLKSYIEHPILLIPNIKFGYETLKYKGKGQSDNNITFGEINLFDKKQGKSNISNEYDFEAYDIAFYYEVLDNYVTADVGLMVKNIKLDITTIDTFKKKTEKAKLDKFYPLLYSKFALEIPTTGVSFKVESDMLKFTNILLLNLDLSVRYEYKFGLGAELGYKINKIKLDSKTNSFDKIDLITTGYYLAVIWDF